ncbi:MAG: YdcF family protein [Acidobacteriota bacterium]
MKVRSRKFLFHLLFVYFPLLILVYVIGLYGLIRQSANRDDARLADAIVVFGAAQYNGRPSPVFRARLDHTALLFKKNLASKIITTGGHGLDSRFTEAGVGKEYLVKQDIPETSITADPRGSTTLESIEKVLSFLKDQKFNSVIAVSDGFHLFRIKRIFADYNVVAYGSPAANSPIESRFKTRLLASLREVFVYTAYLAHRKLNLPVPADSLT